MEAQSNNDVEEEWSDKHSKDQNEIGTMKMKMKDSEA